MIKQSTKWLVLAVLAICGAVLLIFGALFVVASSAHAATNLASACTLASAEGQQRSACTGGAHRFEEAQANTLVRPCKSTRFCPDAERVWTKFGSLSAGNWVEACTADKVPGSAVTECRGSTATQWGALSMVSVGAVAQALEAEPGEPTFPGTFTVSPESGQAPLTVQVTWDLSSFTGGTCTASGSWSGAKALKGTQSVTNLTANASYTLACSRPILGAGSAVLTWTAPTTNTDGSSITNLAGFRIVYGTSASALSQTIQVANPSATSFTVGNLNAATWFFAVRAYNSAGAESSNSNVGSKTVAPGTQSVTATRSVVVSAPPPPVPQPPVLQVVDAQVFNAAADYSILAFKPSVKYGTVALGTPCDPSKPIRDGYFPIPRTAVQWSGTGRTSYPVARCSIPAQ